MFKELVISGASTNFMAILGALDYIYQQNLHHHIHRYVASSIGSVICLLLAIGYTPRIIQDVTLKCNFSDFHDITCDNVLSFFDNLGIITGNKIMNLICSFIKKKNIPTTITFHQFKERFKKSLFITTWCLQDKDTVCMSHKNHPDMEILTAIRMSISIPFMFRPVQWLGKTYVDGAIIDHYPTRFSIKKDSIGICINVNSTVKEPMDITNYINVIMRGITEVVYEYKTKKHKHPFTIEIMIPNDDIINFELTKETKDLLFEIGKKQAKEYVEKNVPDK